MISSVREEIERADTHEVVYRNGLPLNISLNRSRHFDRTPICDGRAHSPSLPKSESIEAHASMTIHGEGRSASDRERRARQDVENPLIGPEPVALATR